MKKFEAHILLVDDDDRIRDLVKEYLNQNNYLVSTAKDSNDAFEKTKIIKFDLIVLDIMMPGKTGLEFTQDYKNKINTPILLLTAKGEPSERIEGLEVGADDYLTKPFDSEILLAKIKSILNRKPSVNTEEKDIFEFDFGEFSFNSKLRILTHKEGDSFKLSPKENQLLKMLVLNFDDLLPRDIALNKIWRDANYFTSRSMDVYIAKLRKYLEKDSSLKIINVHGEGFRLMKD